MSLIRKSDEVIIYSFDSLDGKDFDFLPARATKQTALEYVAEEFGSAREDVVFAETAATISFR